MLPRFKQKCEIEWPISTRGYIDWTICEITAKNNYGVAILTFDKADLVINSFTARTTVFGSEGPVVKAFCIADPEVHLKVIQYLEDIFAEYIAQ